MKQDGEGDGVWGERVKGTAGGGGVVIAFTIYRVSLASESYQFISIQPKPCNTRDWIITAATIIA